LIDTLQICSFPSNPIECFGKPQGVQFDAGLTRVCTTMLLEAKGPFKHLNLPLQQ